jgi:putative endonuclease
VRSNSRRELGARAEALVCHYLTERGFRILGTNVRVGPKEIDVIARRGALIVFCEVRARSTSDFVEPLATLGPRKIQNVRRAAAEYVVQHRLGHFALRFDAASVLFDVPEGRLEYIENAF